MYKEIEKLRKLIGEYHKERSVTRQGVVGRPDLADQVAARRDKTLETKAAADFRSFAQAALGHAPSPAEIESGAALVAATSSNSPIVRGGVRALNSLFGYLVQQEKDIQRELGLVAPGLGSVALRWGAPVVALAGIGTAGYFLLRKKRPPMPGEDGAPELLVEEDDDEQ